MTVHDCKSYRDKESLIMFVVRCFLSINSVGKLLKKAIMNQLNLKYTCTKAVMELYQV